MTGMGQGVFKGRKERQKYVQGRGGGPKSLTTETRIRGKGNPVTGKIPVALHRTNKNFFFEGWIRES